MKKNLVLVILVIAIVAIAAVGFSACSKKTSIGVQAGTVGEYFVKGDADWGYEGFKNLKAEPYSNGGLAVQAMKNGTVKAVILDVAPATTLANEIEGIRVINIPLTQEQYGFAIDKAQPELLTKINNIMASDAFKAKKDEIFAKYEEGGTPSPVEAKTTADASKADQQLVVATNAEFAPFEYKDGTKFAGYDMEIAAYFAEQLGLELVILDMEFDSVVTSVGKNNVDIAMAGLTITTERAKTVNFTAPYYSAEGDEAGQVVIVLKDDTTFDACTTKEQVIEILKTL